MSASAEQVPPMYGDGKRWALIQADSLVMLPELPAESIDAVITDPPYGIGIVGEQWDGGKLAQAPAFQEWTAEWAAAVLRTLKPGGWLAAFGTPRTFHRLVAGVEDAGFEIRDQVLWLYGQGVPKHRRADGLSSCLKPAYEPVLLARKPLVGTLDVNLTAHGTGALQIDAARVPRPDGGRGFWPANIALSHRSRCRSARCEPDCPATLIDRDARRDGNGISRLFYTPKANRKEREAGCEDLPLLEVPIYPRGNASTARLVHNVHPTVKPLELMRWLTRLVCPQGGTVLDPFTGSGSTGAAGVLEGRRFLGIERDARYVPIAGARITHWAATAAQKEVLP